MKLVADEDVWTGSRTDASPTGPTGAWCSLCRIEGYSLALPEMEGDFEELEAAAECAEPGCIQLAAPDGPAFVAGRDHDGNEMYLRKWRCAAGHLYLEPR